MGPAVPLGALAVHQSKVGLVDECGGLEGVPGGLRAHEALGLPVQLLVDGGEEPIERVAITFAPGAEQSGHIGRCGCHVAGCAGGERAVCRR